MSRPFLGSRGSGTYAQALFWAGVAVHSAVVLSLQFSFLNPLFDDSTHRKGKGADFYAVYQAARNIEDNVSIYEKQPAQQVVPYFFPYRYHPIVALTIGQLFSLVPPGVAYGIWIILQELLLFINIILTRRLFGDHPDADLATGFWFFFSPYFIELYMGQFSFLMSSLMFWMLAAMMRGRILLADAAWIGSLCVKSSSSLFVPVLIKMKRWRTVLLAILVVVLLGLPYFLSMPGSLEAFSANFTEPLTMPTLQGNQGFAALVGILLLRLGDNWPDSVYDFPDRLQAMNDALVIPTTILAILVVLFTVFMTIRTHPRYVPELFFLWILAYLLFYKHVWEHHYVMALPVFVLLYYRMRAGSIVLSQKTFWTSFFIIALPTLFVFIDKDAGLGDPELYWSHLESFLFHAPKPVAALALYVALSSALWKANEGNKEESMKIVEP